MIRFVAPLALAVLIPAMPSARPADLTVESAPPVVVKTVPQAGSADVDPASVKAIEVTFSKDMTDKSWSWTSAFQDSVPKGDGAPKYEADKRTCVLPVKLEPGKTYAIWVNTEKFRNFKDATGRPAVPYLLVFKTKG